METVTKTVEIDGEEHEVEVEVDPSDMGYLPKEKFQEELHNRVKTAEKNAREGRFTLDELQENEDLLAELRERNPELFASENGDGDDEATLTEEDLDRFRDKWKSNELDPLQERAEKLESEVQSLRVEKLSREVVEAASDAGFRDDPGVRRALKLIAREEMGYSEQHDEWFRTDGNGFEISTAEDSDYVTVREFLKEMADSGDYDSWLVSDTQEGSGYGGAGESGGPTGFPAHKVKFTDKQKRDFIAQEGIDAWENLPYDEN